MWVISLSRQCGIKSEIQLHFTCNFYACPGDIRTMVRHQEGDAIRHFCGSTRRITQNKLTLHVLQNRAPQDPHRQRRCHPLEPWPDECTKFERGALLFFWLISEVFMRRLIWHIRDMPRKFKPEMMRHILFYLSLWQPLKGFNFVFSHILFCFKIQLGWPNWRLDNSNYALATIAN